MPLRLLLLDGEFHLLAWESVKCPVKDYRLSRFQRLCATHKAPPGAPSPSDWQLIKRIKAHRAGTFRTHGNQDHTRRERIILALLPQTIPHVQGRTWGMDQAWENEPSDLPLGWARLSFTTAGTPAAFHWILSMGAGVIVEKPNHLAKQVKEEGIFIQSLYQDLKNDKKWQVFLPEGILKLGNEEAKPSRILRSYGP